jgi:hypothetical protein
MLKFQSSRLSYHLPWRELYAQRMQMVWVNCGFVASQTEVQAMRLMHDGMLASIRRSM